MPIWDRWLDASLQRLGYEKATRRGFVSPSVIFQGEKQDIPTIVMGEDDALARAERLALCSSWAYSDIDLVAGEFAKAAFSVKRMEGEETTEIPNHPFELLLRKPNPYWSRALLWRYLQYWLQMRGEGYWLLVPDNAGGLAEIWPIPSSRMRPVPDAQNYIAHFSYLPKSKGVAQPIAPQFVCFFRNIVNPFDFHRGLSPLSAARLGLETDYHAQKWNKETFENEATIRTVISLAKEINDRDFNVIKADLESDIKEGKLRYIITRGGDIDIDQLGMSQKDLDYLGGREFTREELDRVFGVPSGYWDKNATQANSEAAKATLAEHTHSLHVIAQETITTQVIGRYYADDLIGGFEDVRPRDRALLVQERRTYWQVKTVEEAREELGLDPLGDERDILLVSELRKPAAGGFQENPEEQEPEEVDKEIKADLRRWEKVARRMVKAGEDPAGYTFASEVIPAPTARAIKAALEAVTTEEEVKAAFAAGFRQVFGWEDYP